MHLSCGYFENRCGKAVDKISCSGGASANKALIEHIAGKFACDVEIWDPLSGIELSEDLSRDDVEMFAPRLAVSLGLSLRD